MCHFKLRKWVLLLVTASVCTALVGCPATNTSGTTVPDVVGLNQLAAYASLASSGLIIEGVIEEGSDSVPEGCVIRQCPQAGSRANAGTKVSLIISSGSRVDEALTVSIEPLEARQAGARWRVDGGCWMTSGQTQLVTSDEPHTVSFKSVSGWQEPTATVINVRESGRDSLVGLYSLSLFDAVFAFSDESISAEEAADELFDAFNAYVEREGYGAAANAMDVAIEQYVEYGGDLHDLTLRSSQIPSARFDKWDVAERRAMRAQLRSKAVVNTESPAEQDHLAGLVTCKGMRNAASDSEDYDNYVIYINGICITYADFLVASSALEERVREIDANCKIHCTGYWNQDGLLLPELGECVAQKILELIEVFRDVTIQNPTTKEFQALVLEEVNAGRNVIVVSHSQGNFHTREAVDDMQWDKRAYVNVLSAGSPVTFMPRGLRNCSRVDVEGDPVAALSLVNFDPFPYEGTWGWGDRLNQLVNRTTQGQMHIPLILLLNHHRFEESYLKGEAGREIVTRLESYLWCPSF